MVTFAGSYRLGRPLGAVALDFSIAGSHQEAVRDASILTMPAMPAIETREPSPAALRWLPRRRRTSERHGIARLELRTYDPQF